MVDPALSEPFPLPHPRTSLIGRDAAIAGARSLLLDAAVPLLTMTGPGGVGKTRLAFAVARDVADHFSDGMFWLDLAPIADPNMVPIVVAAALGLPSEFDQPPIRELTRFLRPRQSLLLLDNCEHLLPGVAELVGEVLPACPALQVLATSRAPLHVQGEQIFPVEPLRLPTGTPASQEYLAHNEAVRLFVERARAVRPGFALTAVNVGTVVALCRTLDGLPLALELAAARTVVLSPEALLAQMTDRLALLTDGPRDAPIRQQTIEATIGWSNDLLPSDDQALFRRLAVFRGGFTLEAAQAAAGVGESAISAMIRGLSTLVDHSLVQCLEGDGEPRFSMLETIRTFAWDRLRASGEEPEARSRHAAWVVGLVDEIEAWVAAYLPQGHAILDRLETEHANLQAALTWFRESDRVSELLSLAAALVDFWRFRGHLREGRQWLEWGLAHAAGADPAAQARGELALAMLAHMQDESKLALTLCEASLRSFRASADGARVARAATEAARMALDAGRTNLTDAYRVEAAAALETLAGVPWAPAASSRLLVLPGILAKNQGDVERAERLLGEVVAAQRALARESGAEQPHAGWPFIAWGAVAHLVRDLPVALERYQTALDHARRGQEARGQAYALTRVASILAMTERWEDAAWMLGAAEAFSERIGLAFTRDVWSLTRAFGVPQPWQGPEDYTGQARAIRTAVLRRAPAALVPISDPDRAIALWSAGHRVPIEEATTFALAVTFDGPPPRRPVLSVPQTSKPVEYGLTPRQQEILALLCDRLTDPEIAARLSVSSRTVEGHVTQILSKLRVANRREAAALAARRALVARP